MNIDTSQFANDPRFWAGILAFCGAVIAALVAAINGWFRLKIELRSAKHEERKWIIDFILDKEKSLHEARIRAYGPVMIWLEKLSHCGDEQLDKDALLKLAAELNSHGYSEAALFMLPQTRTKLFSLREELRGLAMDQHDFSNRVERMRAGNRTDLTEMLRRDLSHNSSDWGRYSTLLEGILETKNSIELKN